jgi:hypothetical protein
MDNRPKVSCGSALAWLAVAASACYAVGDAVKTGMSCYLHHTNCNSWSITYLILLTIALIVYVMFMRKVTNAPVVPVPSAQDTTIDVWLAEHKNDAPAPATSEDLDETI